VVTALEAALSVSAREQNALAAAASAGTMLMELGNSFFEPFGDLIRRAQAAGVVRADITQEDIPRILLMLTGPMTSFTPGCEGWRRYLALMLDALSPVGATDLPPPTPLPELGPRCPTH